MATITSQLGYPDDLIDPTSRLTPSRLAICQSIMTQLDQIDQQITNALADSMAMKVGDLQVNYQAHLADLKREGSRLLEYLAQMADTTLHYDRFSGKRRGLYIDGILWDKGTSFDHCWSVESSL